MYPFQIDGLPDFEDILKEDKEEKDIDNSFKNIKISNEGKKRLLEIENLYINSKKKKKEEFIYKDNLEINENLKKKLKIF
tara:strand:+ start:4926 stop:5165 length:240 start_codon:yes stop_codon:yes gene_type:complete